MENLFNIINLILTFTLAAGGIFAFKSGMSKAAGEIQERVISALDIEITTLKGKVDDLEQENNKLNKIILTLIEALKTKGFIISIDGTLIKITDSKDTIITHIAS